MIRIKDIQWIILAAATLTLGACSSDSEESAQSEVELRFSSCLELQTRAAYTKTQDTQIANGEKVYEEYRCSRIYQGLATHRRW